MVRIDCSRLPIRTMGAALLCLALATTSAHAQAITSVALTANRTPPALVGTAITWTVVPAGGVAPFTYKWWQFDGTTWTLLQDWTENNTYTWTPTFAHANARLGVWVRNAGHTIEETCSDFMYCQSVEFAIVSACTFSMTPESASVTNAGGTGTFNVSTPSGCAWTPNSGATWLTPGDTLTHYGPGTMTWTAALNTTGGDRDSVILIGNQQTYSYFYVTQCGVSVSPSARTVSAAGGTTTFAVTAASGCSWTATTASGSFASITAGSSGTGSGTVTVTYPAAQTTQLRATTLTVGGVPVTVTQEGAACTYTLTPPAVQIGAQGGTGTIQVAAFPAECVWAPNSGAVWLTPGSTATQQGNGTVTWTAQGNLTGGDRETVVLIGNESISRWSYFNATQCSIVLSTTTISAAAAGGTATVNVTASSGCSWTATTPQGSFASVTSGGSGSGNGTVTVTYAAAETTASRTTVLTIGGMPVTINQPGATCTYALTPSSAQPGPEGGSGTIDVTAWPSECTWAPNSGAVWLDPGSTSAREGNGTVHWVAEANTSGGNRDTVVLIGNEAASTWVYFNVSQCSVGLSQTSLSVPAGAGTATISVTASPGCSWITRVAPGSFASVTSGGSGAGNGAVTFAYSGSPTTEQRITVVTIGGRPVTLTQAGAACSYALTPNGVMANAGGETGSFGVTATPSDCRWQANSGVSWLNVDMSIHEGSQAVTWTASPNTSGSDRTGAIHIGPQQFSATQCSYDVSPLYVAMGTQGGSGTLALTSSSPACTWSASSGAPWVTLSAPVSGSGDATLTYTVPPNPDPSSRGIELQVAGRIVYLSQLGTQPVCSYSIDPDSVTAPAEGASYTVSVTAPAGCEWSAVSESNFVGIVTGASGTGNGSFRFTVSNNYSGADDSNAGEERYADIRIANRALHITQLNYTPPENSCAALVAMPTSVSVPSGNVSGSITVSAPGHCTWVARSESNFIRVASSAGGSGNGTVAYTVDNNTQSEPRTGSMLVAGRVVRVIQAGADGESTCTYAVSPSQVTAPPSGGSYSATVLTQTGCAWAVQSQSSFLHTSGSGTGSATFTFSVDVNGSPGSRNGTLSIEGTVLTVTQSGTSDAGGCEIDVDASPETGTNRGQLLINAPAGCHWSATTDVPWIAIPANTGTGTAAIPYRLLSSGMSESSIGQVQVGNRTVTVAGPSASTPDLFCREYRLPCGDPVFSEPSWLWDFCTYVVCLPVNLGGGTSQPPPADPELAVNKETVKRGEVVFFSVSNAVNTTVSDWRFTPDDPAVGSPIDREKDKERKTWPGAIVTSGTVSVVIKRGGATFPRSRHVTVQPRDGWMFPPVNPVKRPQGYTAFDAVGNQGNTLIATAPELGQQGIGLSGPWPKWQIFSRDVATVSDNGPNHRLKWVSNIRDLTIFDWVMHPDVETPSSVFFQKQCGDWSNGPTSTCLNQGASGNNRFISGPNFRDGVARHEAGPQNSHWANYVDAISDRANNFKAIAEGFVRGRHVSVERLIDELEAVLERRKDVIDTLTREQPCTGECTADCLLWNGFMNRLPYALCPP